MTTLTIEIPDKVEKTLIDLIELLGGRVLTTDLETKSIEKKLPAKNVEDFKKIDLSAIIFMKFGYHAKEEKDAIIARKKLEFEKTGKMFWGYGGTICHPLKQVQPFLEDMHSQGKRVFLAMSFTKSKPGMEGVSSLKFSTNNLIESSWENIPDGITVKGSQYAIVCSKLIDCDLKLNLNNYSVAIGSSAKVSASNYIRNRIDKACLIKTNSDQSNPNEMGISLLAEVVEPYAVFIR